MFQDMFKRVSRFVSFIDVSAGHQLSLMCRAQSRGRQALATLDCVNF